MQLAFGVDAGGFGGDAGGLGWRASWPSAALNVRRVAVANKAIIRIMAERPLREQKEEVRQ